MTQRPKRYPSLSPSQIKSFHPTKKSDAGVRAGDWVCVHVALYLGALMGVAIGKNFLFCAKKKQCDNFF